MKEKLSLTKDCLLARVAKRARSRYGFCFVDSFFNDLLKDRLMLPPQRGTNAGKRPRFTYDRRHYRRSLQIVRLVVTGFKSRDTQRVALFLKGYGLTPREIRKPLVRLYSSQSKCVFRGVRSTYIDNSADIPAGQKERLLQSLGKPDPRLVAAKVVPSSDIILNAVRAARQRPLARLSVSDARETLQAFISGRLDSRVLRLFDGLLLQEAPVTDGEPDIDYIEKFIRQTPDDAFYRARENFWRFQSASSADSSLVSTPIEMPAVMKLVAAAIRTDPTFMVLAFVQLLRIAVEEWSLPKGLAADENARRPREGFTMTER
jgi:hypothetical protein